LYRRKNPRRVGRLGRVKPTLTSYKTLKNKARRDSESASWKFKRGGNPGGRPAAREGKTLEGRKSQESSGSCEYSEGYHEATDPVLEEGPEVESVARANGRRARKHMGVCGS
jgi:hypothetical protein